MGRSEAMLIMDTAVNTAKLTVLENSFWGSVYYVVDGVFGLVPLLLLPVQYISTIILGMLVRVSFGLLLLPMGLIWLPLMLLLLAGSKAWMAVPILRPFLLLPQALVAMIATVFVQLMPSMGEWDSRMSKLAICYGSPASHVAMQFWSQGKKTWDTGSNNTDSNDLVEDSVEEARWNKIVWDMRRTKNRKFVIGPILRDVELPIPVDGKLFLRFKSDTMKNNFMEEMQDQRSIDALNAAIADAYGFPLEFELDSV